MITAEKQLKLLPGRQRSNVPQNFFNELCADMRARQDSTQVYEAVETNPTRFGLGIRPQLGFVPRQENRQNRAELGRN